MNRQSILKVFEALPDRQRSAGKRHQATLCLALFTLAVVASNRGFLAIGDMLYSYRQELIALFNPSKDRLPSYSTIRRVLIGLDYSEYSGRKRKIFRYRAPSRRDLSIPTLPKVLRGSYQLETDVRLVRH